MADDDRQRVRRGRRDFVIGSLGVGVGGAGLLGGLIGCDRAAPPQKQPPAPPAAAPSPVAEAPPSAAPTTPTELAEPPLPDGKDPRHFIKHGDSPLTLETRREALGSSVLTATRRLFVRQNLPLPPPELVADRDGWQTEFAGVERPASLRADALRGLGHVTMATVLQCSGNGRKYYGHGPSGSQWGVGAAGCVMWSGVPIRDVVDALGGLAPGVRYMTTTGGEPLPDGVPREKVVVERSIPIDKALDDCFLAWELNGEPLPRSHGGPLRLIVPGYFGCNQIKFVKRVAFTAEQAEAKIQKTGYRMRPIGVAGSPEQPAMWAMPVKSFIMTPNAATPVAAGQVRVTGVAFGGTQAVKWVEVSSDGGKRWQQARFLGPDLGKYAWRMFELTLPAEIGPLSLVSRATAADGSQQPEHRNENERGYGNNSWRDMGVTVSVCAPGDAVCLSAVAAEPGPRRKRTGPVVLSEQGKRGKQIFQQLAQPPCTTCHTLEDAAAIGKVGPDLDQLGRSFAQVKSAVTNGVGVMPPFGKTLSAEEIEAVARYVFEATH